MTNEEGCSTSERVHEHLRFKQALSLVTESKQGSGYQRSSQKDLMEGQSSVNIGLSLRSYPISGNSREFHSSQPISTL